MVICVYGAASNRIEKKFLDRVFNLGKALAERGHSLVYGAGADGVMGAAARGFKAGGGKVHGVIPKFFEEGEYEAIFYEADKLTYTQTMAERKTIMENSCDCFIIAPGGIGTMEEFFQVLTLKQLGRHKKAIVIYDCFGYFDNLEKMIQEGMEQGFINKQCENIYKILEDDKKIIEYLENYSDEDVEWSLLKKNS